MKSESPSYKLQTVSGAYDLFKRIGHVVACKTAQVVVATCFAIISSVAITSAETVVLYGNIPDPFTRPATSADLHPTNKNISWMMGQQFVTGELGIVSSISLPVAISGSLTGVLRVEIWDHNSGKPGKKVASVGDIDLDGWTGANLEYQMVMFDRPVTGLESNTKYYVIFNHAGPNISGFGRTYFIPGTADSEGTNNAGKFQVIVNGNWRFASDFRGSSNNYMVMEVLEISPLPIDEHTLTIQQPDHGTVATIPEQESYPSGTEVTLTATPSEGYQFTKWLIGEDESLENPLTFTIEADTTVTPEFAEIPATFTLTIPASDGGTVVASPEMEVYQEGTTVTLTATANEGYAFAGWEGDTDEEGNPLTITLLMDSDKSIAAKFVPSARTVVLYGNIPDPFPSEAAGGDFYFPHNRIPDPKSAQSFVTGELGIVSSISLPIAVNGSPKGVVHFQLWDDNAGKPGKSVASVGDIDLDSWNHPDREYHLVTFDSPVTGLEPNTQYFVVWDNSDTNDVSGFSNTWFAQTIVGSEGTNNAAKFQLSVNGNWTDAATFSPQGTKRNYLVIEILEISSPPIDELTLTIQPSDQGTVTRSPELESYPSGTEVTLTATPSEGYQFTKWLIGETESIDNPLTFTIEADTTVTPEFAEIPATFTLTIPAIDGGTVVANPEMETYDEGTTVTLTATPNEGYALAGWEGDTNEEGNPLTITLIMDSDKSVAAKFRPVIIPEIVGVVFDSVARSVSMTWLSHPDALYEIQESADLVRWETLETKQGTGEQTTAVLDSAPDGPNGPNGERQRFYRLREMP